MHLKETNHVYEKRKIKRSDTMKNKIEGQDEIETYANFS